MSKTYVLDTNVLIQAPYAMQCFEDNHVVIPLVVVKGQAGTAKTFYSLAVGLKKIVTVGKMKGSPLCYQLTMMADECERSPLALDAIQRL